MRELLDGIDRYARPPQYGDAFGAQVFKIARDAQGNRLSYLKITGRSLTVRTQMSGEADGGWQEKVNQIRIYSGEKFQTVECAESGMVCGGDRPDAYAPRYGAGRGSGRYAGSARAGAELPVVLPEGCDAHTMLQHLRQLEEEEPLLRVVWNERHGARSMCNSWARCSLRS